MTISPAEARSVTVSIAELAGLSRLEVVARLVDGSVRRPPMAETLPLTQGRLHTHGTSTCLVVSRKP